MAKLSAMEYHPNLTADERRAQAVYLKEVALCSMEQIADITRYAISTVKRYVSKFAYLLDTAKRLFTKGRKATAKAGYCSKVQGRYCGISTDVEIKEGFTSYVMEFFNERGESQCVKVGYTGKSAFERARGILEYWSRKFGGHSPYASVRIRQAYYAANEDDALTIENELRKAYKQQFEFEPKDRFPGGRVLDELPDSFYRMCELLNVTKAPALAQ